MFFNNHLSQEGKTADEMEVLVGMYNVFRTY